jgi:DNA-binding CsgD family transcriptional regulator
MRNSITASPGRLRDDRHAGAPRASGAVHAAYHGPERRRSEHGMAHWLRCMLDEIDYGMVLLDGTGHVLHANHAAHAELGGEHPLRLVGRELGAQQAPDADELGAALEGARLGLRRLLMLGPAQRRVSVSVVPLTQGVTLLVLGKRQVCERLSVQGFARGMGLTPAETRVLEALCAGLRPREIAQRQGVAVSTVRTQIGSVRAKTGVASIRELVRQVAVLPPMVGALKGAAVPAGLEAVLSMTAGQAD